MRISAIVPCLNEMECLPRTVGWLAEQKWVDELIVVDGGSTDGTREWLDRRAGGNLRVLDAPRGRGNQLNAGARAAIGDTLVFLHADCRLPSDAGDRLKEAFASASRRVAGGCFCVRFEQERPRSLAVVAAGINLRARITRTATGDQGIFVRRTVFEKARGFRDWPLFEDVDFVTRIKQEGQFVVIPSRMTMSGRRHVKDGVFRTVFFIYALRVGFWLGVSPFVLDKWFRQADLSRSSGSASADEVKAT